MLKKILPKPVKQVLRRLIGRPPERPFQPYLKQKNVEGVAFDFWIGDSVGRDWYDLRATDPVWAEMRFIKDHLLTPGDRVLECGGHHGCTAILLSNWVGTDGQVVTFEPLPANCSIIEKNIALNRLTNVTVVRKAVGAGLGKIAFSEESNSAAASSGKGPKVELTCLDEYEHLKPTFLKIDVEGFELEVLRGARKVLANRPKFAMEIHSDELAQFGATPAEVLGMLGIGNYKAWIQWDDSHGVQEYDGVTPITKRVHLFGIPLANRA